MRFELAQHTAVYNVPWFNQFVSVSLSISQNEVQILRVWFEGGKKISLTEERVNTTQNVSEESL